MTWSHILQTLGAMLFSAIVVKIAGGPAWAQYMTICIIGAICIVPRPPWGEE